MTCTESGLVRFCLYPVFFLSRIAKINILLRISHEIEHWIELEKKQNCIIISIIYN